MVLIMFLAQFCPHEFKAGIAESHGQLGCNAFVKRYRVVG